jgi:hypothetical protein
MIVGGCRQLRACREMRPHLARRESGTATPAAQHSPPLWPSTLNLQGPPSSLHLRRMPPAAWGIWWVRAHLAPGKIGARKPVARIHGAHGAALLRVTRFSSLWLPIALRWATTRSLSGRPFSRLARYRRLGFGNVGPSTRGAIARRNSNPSVRDSGCLQCKGSPEDLLREFSYSFRNATIGSIEDAFRAGR